MRPDVDFARGVVEFQASRRLFNARLLAALAEEFAQRAEITYTLDEGHVSVRVAARERIEVEALWQLAGDVANEWLNRQCRQLRARRARREAALIVTRALTSALTPRPRRMRV